MKKFAYLCVILLINMNLIAQIDPYDRNWDTIVFDDFDQPNRRFNSNFWDSEGMWLSFSPRCGDSGITKWQLNQHGDTIANYQIYQWNHCIFDGIQGILKLCSEFVSDDPILCEEPLSYYLPPDTLGKHFQCDTDHHRLHYYSGMIESIPWDWSQTNEEDCGKENLHEHLHGIFRYGYFEIRLKTPVHKGSYSAFWLWDSQDTYYEAIDIFEYSWDFTGKYGQNTSHPPFGSPRHFTSGVDFNHIQEGRVFTGIPQEEEDLTGWHVFSCKWLPERVTLYRDGIVISEVTGRENIPSHPLTLKTTYAIDKYVCATKDTIVTHGPLVWKDTDTMYVDYIKVLQLKCDCENDKVIACQNDLDTLNFKVKRSYNITSTYENVQIGNTDKVTFRATDSFLISGPFQADIGSELTVIMQECPDNTVNFSPLTNKKETP